jgi:hypothetical protein
MNSTTFNLSLIYIVSHTQEHANPMILPFKSWELQEIPPSDCTEFVKILHEDIVYLSAAKIAGMGISREDFEKWSKNNKAK